MTPAMRRALQTWCIPVVVILLWEVATRAGVLDRRFFVPLSDVVVTIVEQFATGRLGGDMAITVQRLVISFAVAAVLGVAIGVASGVWRTVELMIRPVTDTLYPLPKIALLPLFIIIVGRGEIAYILTAFATAFFQIVISTRGSVRDIDSEVIEAGRNFGATGWRYVTRLLFPAISGPLFDGLRLGMATCLITLIAAEFVGAETGVGAMIRRAGQQFAVEQMYAGLVLVGVLGLLIDLVFRVLRPALLPWERGTRRRGARTVAAGG
ncbi:nitrate ABC transporter permease [Pseudoclavibacter endophyticus]|uniref:ABC transporter permease n=1 Tax=Pseudoclavibacter endophyticus TaxID=1778590 RepID=A0A6H9WNP3_9MICO|nr:ABC transporter permease [Pseudoclavibacter endophyticus]KAB1646699.1 ABC transporter permease [Pseudoclavibacter endophyticus]GGA76311.1 nitrate ABC transporter permease [Pseudoclavibacter endophyticus]